MNRLAIVALLALAPSCLAAEVLDSSASGFTLKQTVNVRASPQEVYRRIFKVGDWWSSDHALSHDAHNLSLEEKVGGCFCEKMPDGGGVKHMEVVSLAPGKSVVLRGGLGPFMTMAALVTLEIQLTPSEGGTKVDVTFSAGGYLPAGLNTYAHVVDGVVQLLFTGLKNYVEQGDPKGKA